MNLSEFEKIICLYGCDEKKWSDKSIDEMKILLKSSEDARLLLNEYSSLEKKLNEISVDSLSDVKINKAILEITSKGNQGNGQQISIKRGNLAFYRIAASIAVAGIAIAVIFSTSDTSKIERTEIANNTVEENTNIAHVSDKDIDSLFDEIQNDGLETVELLALLD